MNCITIEEHTKYYSLIISFSSSLIYFLYHAVISKSFLEYRLLCTVWQCRWRRAVGGGVTQATGHHRWYWFVVSLVLQPPSLSHPPTHPSLRPARACVPHTPRMSVHVCYITALVCVGVRLCTQDFRDACDVCVCII